MTSNALTELVSWQKALDRYKQRYKSREEMGTLAFSQLSIKPIGPDFTLADGRWELTRFR